VEPEQTFPVDVQIEPLHVHCAVPDAVEHVWLEPHVAVVTHVPFEQVCALPPEHCVSPELQATHPPPATQTGVEPVHEVSAAS
jgi:hypothetical protein